VNYASKWGIVQKYPAFLPILKSIGGQSRNYILTTGNLIYEATYCVKTTGLSAIIFP
jgi:hypothetical protein